MNNNHFIEIIFEYQFDHGPADVPLAFGGSGGAGGCGGSGGCGGGGGCSGGSGGCGGCGGNHITEDE